MKIEFVDVTLEHVIYLVPRMRAHEREAYTRLFGDNFERDIVREVNLSVFSRAGLVDGQCVAIWGIRVAGLLSDEGYIWMIGTDFIDTYKLTFLRHSRKAVEEIRPLFKSIHGMVIKDFTCGKKWLRWLGFIVDEATGPVCRFHI